MEPRQLFVPFPADKPPVVPVVKDTEGPTSEGDEILTGLGNGECSTLLLPAGGVLSSGTGSPLMTLSRAAIFTINCPPGSSDLDTTTPLVIANTGLELDDSDTNVGFSDFRDPFYASTFPVCYALAATTVTAYMLVIMLFITPRSFLDGGIIYLGRRRGFTSGGGAGNVTIGGRPWLQKVAALTVAISLTVATVATFRVAERQYSWGVQDARRLQLEVMDGTLLKIIRLVSDTFLWLAQAQTLIRLFPRHREKVIIKWAAFALITLDVIFSALNSFQYANSDSNGNTRPRSFVDAIPALSYLFQLALGLLYAAWVIYYAFMKKRYAFYHPWMKNMCLVAAISLISILVPVVFFTLDISKSEFTGWGDYVRWVGAAAASVVVWEWVERIEALEREEKKGGILGREVFDGDDAPESSPSDYLRRLKKGRRDGGDPESGDHGGFHHEDDDYDDTYDDDYRSGAGGDGRRARRRKATHHRRPRMMLNARWPNMSSLAGRRRARDAEKDTGADLPMTMQPTNETTATETTTLPTRLPLWPPRPAPAVTTVSRADTASADSTVYAVRRYHPNSDASGRTPDPQLRSTSGLATNPRSSSSSIRSQHDENAAAADDVDGEAAAANSAASGTSASDPTLQPSEPNESELPGETAPPPPTTAAESAVPQSAARARPRWRALASAATPLFRRGTHDPPPEVLPHAPPRRPRNQKAHTATAMQQPRPELRPWDIRGRLEDLAAVQADKMRERLRPAAPAEQLPITIIPAPARPGEALARVLEEDERTSGERSSSTLGSDWPSRTSQGGVQHENEGQRWAVRAESAIRSPPGSPQSMHPREPNFVAPPMWPGVYSPRPESEPLPWREPSPEAEGPGPVGQGTMISHT